MIVNGDHAEILINDVPCSDTKQGKFIGNVVGFRGSANSTLIDNVSFQGTNPTEKFYDGFEKENSGWLLCFVLFILFNTLFFLFYRRKSGLLAIMLNFAVLTAFISIFYVYFGQNLYPKKWMIFWHEEPKVKDRLAFKKQLFHKYSSPPFNKYLKIILVGSSQTWGTGASTDETTWARLFETGLKKQCNTENICCINVGIPGSNSGKLLKNYTDRWIWLKPDICIIDLSNNDRGSPKFRGNLSEFIRLNNINNIETVFICEPITEYRPKPYQDIQIMKELAVRYHVRIIDMYSYLLPRQDDGFLFWDFIHLTDYGQKLFADKLLTELKEVVCSKASAKSSK